MASVSSPDAVDPLEAKSKGYIRVLVLDPREVIQSTNTMVILYLFCFSSHKQFPTFCDRCRLPSPSVSLQILRETLISHLPLPP